MLTLEYIRNVARKNGMSELATPEDFSLKNLQWELRCAELARQEAKARGIKLLMGFVRQHGESFN